VSPRTGRPTIDDIRAAARRIAGLAWRTPLLPSPWLSDATGAEVRLKLEGVQATGSFKLRGAANAVALVKERRNGVTTVMTVSAGNHGLALATAAARHGLRARVHLPATAPDAKRAALVRLGACIVEAPTYDAADDAARDEAASPDTCFVSPYDDDDVIAGAGTVALEVFDEWPDVDMVVVPVGGGGLISGVAIAGRALVPQCDVVGVEAAASPVFTSALAAGRPVTVKVGPTLADGLAGNMDPGTRTFAIVRELVERVVRVGEDQIGAAMRGLILRDRVVAEGAGAVGAAALLASPEGERRLAGRRLAVVVSGRNVDAAVLEHVLGVTR
jgi:threonine dehydratase